MSETVNIGGLDRVEVLRALYAGAMPQGLGWLHAEPGDLDRDLAQELLQYQRGHLDYVKGRVLKVTLEEDAEGFSPGLYDRDNGEGAAQRQVDELRMRGGKWGA